MIKRHAVKPKLTKRQEKGCQWMTDFTKHWKMGSRWESGNMPYLRGDLSLQCLQREFRGREAIYPEDITEVSPGSSNEPGSRKFGSS